VFLSTSAFLGNYVADLGYIVYIGSRSGYYLYFLSDLRSSRNNTVPLKKLYYLVFDLHCLWLGVAMVLQLFQYHAPKTALNSG
jgi:hypothetical protein